MLGFVVTGLAAQDPGLLDAPGIRQALATEKDKAPAPDATPKNADTRPKEDLGAAAGNDLAVKVAETRRLAAEIKALKDKEKGPKRFAEDLFDFRESMTDGTEGGISEDYVLGAGDKLQVLGFGSATFELASQVDGRGNLAIPKVGTLKVAGMTLGKARAAAQAMVNRQMSGTSVDLTVTKLREVRVFVLGEVYRPGSYLVPSLSSLVNVLGLAGGPTAMGSFRQIRVMRGGRLVHQVDLYPLRAEGLGNMNFSLQNGDTVFVPLAFNLVTLEGSFTRVTPPEADADKANPPVPVNPAEPGNPAQAPNGPEPAPGLRPYPVQPRNGAPLAPPPRTALDRVAATTLAGASPDSLQFELLPGETAQDALRFAGGLLPKAYAWGLTLRRQDERGVTNGQDLPMNQLGSVTLKAGDVLSALPRRDRVEQVVTVAGWARVPGAFARTEGLRVGALLKRDGQVMPDTYLLRGDIVRTLPDGTTRYLGFNVAKALAGDPDHDLVLADRDRVSLYNVNRMRLDEQVTLSGPFTQAGTYPLHEGMRVADLVFLAGIPRKEANRLNAELARTRLGQPSEVRTLDLARLVSTETDSPVRLEDETLNPLLKPDDQITVFAKPQFKVHRSVRISGQVARPGTYVLDEEHPTLSRLVDRAGGLTPLAMPNAGMFFRSLALGDDALAENRTVTSSGVEEILERLNETKLLDPSVGSGRAASGQVQPFLFKVPVLHGLNSLRLNRVVVDFTAALAHRPEADIELNDRDEIIIPRRTDTAMVLGEAATPFAFFKVTAGMKVGDLLKLAGGTTRNADTWNIRLLKADGRILERWVNHQTVEPGDSLLIPQVVRRDIPWQETLTALTPLAILINAVRK